MRNGYIFQGWATAQEAFAPEYQPGSAYTADEDLTLYAVWEQEVPSGSVVLTGNMGTKMSNAVDMQFGTRYTKSWNSSTDHLNCYNKITLTTGGILSIYATKPYDADEYGSLELYLYNSSGDLVWGNETYRAKADSHDYYALFVGLNKGTYYLTMKPGFIVKSGTIRTTYNVSFRADAYCEAEPNETAASATPMELNRSYFAFLGEDGAYNTEKEDYFRFTVAEGRTYTIRSGCFAALGGSTILIDLIDPEGSRTSIANEMERNSDADGNSYYSFVPEVSGIYQIRIYNYSGRQISYSIGVFTDPPQEEQSYTVTYDPNGGAGAPANQRKTSDSRLRLSSVEPARPGYRFLGWGTSVGSTVPEYMPGDLYDKDSDLSLFAIWEVQTAEGNRDLGSATGYTTTSTAVDAAFGTGYTRGWTKSTYRYDTYHKLVMPQNGVLSITATKPFDSEKYGKLTFTLLDSSGNTVWGNGSSYAVDNSAEEYRLYVGVPAGTYYLSIKPGFSVTSGTVTTSYSFLFTATDSAEKEPNESAAAATRMDLNRLYLGYLGNDGARKTEEEDYYSFDAVEGNNYTIVSDNYAALASSTAIINIISPSGKSSSIGQKLQNQVNKDGRNYISFNALATGTYSLRIYNYGAAQISYTIGVFEGVPEENEQTYTVTYNANGGHGGIPRQTRTRDTQLILTNRIPERDQYTFQGWGLSANAKTPAYQPGDIYDQDKDITLYALWKFGCTNHQRDDGTVAKEPTCTEEGSTVYCCRICGEYLGQEPIPALGHDAVTDAAVAATCTDSGLTEGSHCARCGVTLTAQQTVEALGHDPVEETPYPATCTQPGLAEGSHCARCGETLTHVEIPALGHTPVILPAMEPTCTQPGMTEGAVCQVCGDTLTEQLPLDALGHDFAEGLCTRCGASDGVTPVSGTVGECAWRFDPATGYLTVTGGSVPDFGDPASAPWYGFAGDITELILSDAVSAIGENAFTNLTGLRSVWIEGTQAPDIAGSNTSLLAEGVGMYFGASEIVPDTVTELDCSKQTGYELNIGFLPAGTQAQLRCSSSDESIARVDGEGRITLTGKLGNVVITVEDVHGIAAPVTMPIRVYYVTKSLNLTLTADLPANGLPVGEQAQLSVFAGEESIPAELAEFRVESGAEFITVDEAGEITAVAPGTAAVRVTLRGGDPLDRTAVFHVRVTLAQAAQGFLAADAEGNMLDTAQGLYLQVSAAVTTYTLTLVDGEGQPLPVSGYTFAVSDTRVAKAAVAKNGTVTLTVPKNAAGACTVTATPKDKALKTAVVSLPVYVRDYTPRVDSTNLTMNSYMDCGVSTALVASYGNTIAGELRLLEKVKVGKAFVYQPCTAFTASVEGEVLTIAAAERGSCPAGKYSLRLEIPGTLAESSLDLTLTVKNTLPKLTVKQTGKPNLFLTDAEGTLSVAAAGAVIRAMELDAPGYDAHDNGDGTMTLTRCEEAVAKKGTLTVYLEGYNTPCTANVSIGTVKTKPALVLSPAAGTINAGERSDVVLQVSQKGSTGAMDLTEGFRVSCTGDFAAELTDQGIRLTPGASVLHAAKKTTFSTVLSLTRDNWTGPVTLSYKLTVQPAAVLPTAKLAASSLTLNSRYPAVTAAAVLTTDQQNMPVARIEAVCAKTDRIRLDYDAETGKITAALIGEAAPGSYPFTVQPYADDGRLLKPLKLTVKVINTAVTVTAKLTGKLDTVRPEAGAATATLTVKNVTAPAEEIYALSPTGKLSATVVDGSALFDITMGRPDAKGQPTAQIRLKPNVTYSTKLTYSLRLACLLEGAETFVTKDLSIKVTQSAVKAAAVPASATVYQSQSRTRTVTFRVSLTSPAGAGIRQIDLGTVNSLFRTSLADGAGGISWNIDQDGLGATVRVTIRDTSRLKQGQKYILPLLITPEGNASNVAPVKLNVTLTVKK